MPKRKSAGSRPTILSHAEAVADATLRITCGDSSGSGFQFVEPEIVVTNHHVVESAPGAAVAATEDGQTRDLTLLGQSSKAQHDFAIYRINGDVPDNRTVLKPADAGSIERGRRVMFAGFPHGIEDLLVQAAMVSGPVERGFYIDGSVNEGNSGGPIVDADNGQVLAIVTQRRFRTWANWEEMREASIQLQQHLSPLAGMTVEIMGVNFGAFASMVAQTNLLVQRVVEANANTGLGIGFKIEYVMDECKKLGIA